MTRESASRKRDKLAATLTRSADILRGSLLERTTFHSTGCPKCARGEGHPQWVLNVNYPGAKTRQLSLRPEQVPLVRQVPPSAGSPRSHQRTESTVVAHGSG